MKRLEQGSGALDLGITASSRCWSGRRLERCRFLHLPLSRYRLSISLPQQLWQPCSVDDNSASSSLVSTLTCNA
jgi:hypothetical protein